MDLSIIIVSWNVKEKLEDNLQAIFNSQGDFSYEVFVVDNNSKDESVKMIREKYPQVKLIANKDNLGFAKANNQAVKEAKGDFILLLNPDMRVFPETLKDSLAWAKANEQAVVSGFKLLNMQGEVIKQVRRFPKLFDQFVVTSKLAHFFPKLLNNYIVSDFDYEKAAKVDSIRGAFFLINKKEYQKISNLDRPYLDERYFIWFEEVDFCRQVQELGAEVWYSPVAKCIDYTGASFSQVKRGVTQRYFRDSMLAYFKKWESSLDYHILNFSWKVITLFL